MQELGQFDNDFQEKQKELLKAQQKFELEQKILSEKAPEIEAKEKKRMRIISWSILGLMLLFIFFLGFRLLL